MDFVYLGSPPIVGRVARYNFTHSSVQGRDPPVPRSDSQASQVTWCGQSQQVGPSQVTRGVQSWQPGSSRVTWLGQSYIPAWTLEYTVKRQGQLGCVCSGLLGQRPCLVTMVPEVSQPYRFCGPVSRIPLLSTFQAISSSSH